MRTLVLNASYVPYDVWSWEKAMTKLFSDNPSIFTIVEYEKTVRDGKGNHYPVPAVVVLNKYIDKHDKPAPYSKANIFARDQNVCQYCGIQFPEYKLTLDHVVPKAHWNNKRFNFKLSSFENVVTACGPCNRGKRNRTPQQANMVLLRKPKRISQAQAYKFKLLLGNIPKEWQDYINKDEEYERTLQKQKEKAKDNGEWSTLV